MLPPSEAEPVFILGSVRSGTSVMVNALKDGAGMRGYYEGNVASLMQQLFDVTEQYFANFSPDYLAAKEYHLIASLDPRAIETVIQNYFATVFEVKLGAGRWVLKSPDSYLKAPMVRASRHLAAMFPKAKFVYCMRRGIENVLSRERKFTGVPFWYHCQSWAHGIEEWLKLKPELGDRAIEVRQRDMATRPRTVADRLAAFLSLDDEEARGVFKVLEGPRMEQIHAANEHRERGLDETPWDEGHRSTFLRLCGPAMEAAGYSLVGEDYQGGVPVRIFYPKLAAAVRTQNVHPEWGFTEVDQSTFQIHPNRPGEGAAEVRWPGIALKGECRFAAEVRLGHEQARPVRFGLRIERSSDGHVCVENRLELADVLSWRRAEMKFSPLMGLYDVVLSAEMAPRAATSNFAWAQFRDVQLY